jgi:hypothetical protein
MMIVIVVCYDMTLSRTRVREIDVYRYFCICCGLAIIFYIDEDKVVELEKS